MRLRLPFTGSRRRPIRKLLIANRGEIAVRVIRSARDMGISTVAVYSDADMLSQACDLADEALSLGSDSPADTYLSFEAILAAAKKSGADAIHPGYGFLSEDADFARAVERAGLTWIGPSSEAIRRLGDKISARTIAASSTVPVIPGGPLPASLDEARGHLVSFARRHGYPILVKRADAGGGRGITRIDDDEAARRFIADLESAAALDGCFVEKMVMQGRHVETQCMRDEAGSFTVVTTRDCSVQRRNQKVVEEAPAPHLPVGVDEAIRTYSKALFDAVDYIGVGTCEFLVTGDAHVYFLEVNPRLQVEHTVSEEVAGIDLVMEQLRIAQGEPLCELPAPRGHAFEVRITSEDPANDLMPATGTITRINWPGGPGVRVDSFIRDGDSIGSQFDSLVAKLIVSGATRAIALARLARAIDEFTVEGLPTSSPLLSRIITHPDFAGPDSPFARRAADANEPEHVARWPHDSHPFAVYTKWMEDLALLDEVKANLSSTTQPVPAAPDAPDAMESFTIELDGKRTTLKVPMGLFGRQRVEAPGTPTPVRRQILRKSGRKSFGAGGAVAGPSITAPIQATVVRITCKVGQSIAEGDLVAVLESMKMEKPILAAAPGVVTAIHVSAGDTVKTGDLLITATPAKEDA